MFSGTFIGLCAVGMMGTAMGQQAPVCTQNIGPPLTGCTPPEVCRFLGVNQRCGACIDGPQTCQIRTTTPVAEDECCAGRECVNANGPQGGDLKCQLTGCDGGGVACDTGTCCVSNTCRDAGLANGEAAQGSCQCVSQFLNPTTGLCDDQPTLPPTVTTPPPTVATPPPTVATPPPTVATPPPTVATPPPTVATPPPTLPAPTPAATPPPTSGPPLVRRRRGRRGRFGRRRRRRRRRGRKGRKGRKSRKGRKGHKRRGHGRKGGKRRKNRSDD